MMVVALPREEEYRSREVARYTAAVCKLCRHSGEKLMLKGSRCLGPKCAKEKQKARHSYGIMERQFRRLFTQAEKQSGITGENLLVLLERRLDNVIYRLGFADSRSQARQLVQHGHIMLNGRKTNIPSCLAKEGDTISWKESSAKTEYYKQTAQNIEAKSIPSWLSLDKEKLVGRISSLPTPDDIDAKFEGKAIVEHYSR